MMVEQCEYRLPCGVCTILKIECPHLKNNELQKSLNFYLNSTEFIPIPCRTCSNHPSNGGSGICNCTLGTVNTCSYTAETTTKLNSNFNYNDEVKFNVKENYLENKI